DNALPQTDQPRTSRHQPLATPQPMNPTQTPPNDLTSTPTITQDSAQLTSKIDRLPNATRDMINLMLDDGLPYRIIIDELAEAGRGLTPQSLTQWLTSGYDDYL